MKHLTPAIGLRLCCYYCGAEMVPVRKMSFVRAYELWIHIDTKLVSCPIRDHVLKLEESLADARNAEFIRRHQIRTEPWPTEPIRGTTDGDEFFDA